MTNNKLGVQVRNFLERKPCIRKDMHEGLINVRALARHIIETLDLDTTVNAVMGIIRRYELEETGDIFFEARKILARSNSISTRSNLVNISLVKDITSQKLLPELFSLIHYNQGDVLRITHADESIKVLVDNKNLDLVKDIFPKDKIISIDKDLAEINLHQHPEAKFIPGVIAVTSNELAMHGVNILETISCFPEWVWIVDEKDLVNAYTILNQLCQK